MHNFDRPLFKRLSFNDTGGAAGHTGAIVITKQLLPYFPQLTGTATAASPTAERKIRAALFVGNLQVGLVEARYQYQTRGGKRPPEYWLTENLGAIRNPAAKDDFVLIERSLSDPVFYRLTLHKAGTPDFAALLAKVGSRRQGAVDTADTPVPETEVVTSEAEQEARELAPLELFDNTAALHETRTLRVARSQAFKRRLLPLYDFRCAVCGLAHADSGSAWEAEAAHIVPRGLKGADDARNGLTLCRSHHWAFDRGLFGILPTHEIILRPVAAAEPRNAHLLPFAGQILRKPVDLKMMPSSDALAWHLKNIAGL